MDEPTRGIGEGEEPLRAASARGSASASSGTRKGKRTTGAEHTDLDHDTEMRTRQIHEEIANTRAEMSETVEAIQEKLRPSNIVSEGT